MAIPQQASVWDEGRNTSRLRRPSPTALPDALKALAQLRRSHPELVRWLEDGHPRLTEAEHVERFGESYETTRRRR